MWIAVPAAAAIVETFLGWLPFLQLARTGRGMITGAALQRILQQLQAHELVPLPVPGFSTLRLMGHYIHLLWIRAALPLLAYGNSARQPAGEPHRRVRIQHYRPLRSWPSTHATFSIPRGSVQWAMNLFVDPAFAGATDILEASVESPEAQHAWQVIFRERFQDDQGMELRTTAVQIQRDGFQIEFFEEAVAVWDATSDDDEQPGSITQEINHLRNMRQPWLRQQKKRKS